VAAMSARALGPMRLVAMLLVVLGVLCVGSNALAALSHQDCAGGACDLHIGCRPEASAPPPVLGQLIAADVPARGDALRPAASKDLPHVVTSTPSPDCPLHHHVAPRAPPVRAH
jgi:hypothetical protein